MTEGTRDNDNDEGLIGNEGPAQLSVIVSWAQRKRLLVSVEWQNEVDGAVLQRKTDMAASYRKVLGVDLETDRRPMHLHGCHGRVAKPPERTEHGISDE